jgi:putative transcriptional regulator
VNNNIKYYRKKLNLTQEDMAGKLNVSRQTINAIENNKYNPSLELAIKLSRLLDVTVEGLFTLDE